MTTRRDALIWDAVDRVSSGEDARTVCRELELDLIRQRAERLLTHQDKLIALLRSTNPERIPSRKAAA